LLFFVFVFGSLSLSSFLFVVFVICFFSSFLCLLFFFFFILSIPVFFTLSLHDALPILIPNLLIIFLKLFDIRSLFLRKQIGFCRSEEHTSELQSRFDLVCRLLLEKKKIYIV